MKNYLVVILLAVVALACFLLWSAPRSSTMGDAETARFPKANLLPLEEHANKRSLLIDQGLKRIEPRLMEIDELQQIIERMESAYIDISVDYTWHQDPPMTVEDIAGKDLLISIGKEHMSFTTARPFSDRSLSSHKIKFMTEHGDTFDSEAKESYNGSIAKYLSIGGWPTSTTSGTITKRKDFMPISSGVTPLKFSVFRFHPRGVPLSEELKDAEICRINSQIVKINDCNSISVEFSIPSGPVYQRIYFSMDHDYTPVRFELIGKGKVIHSIDVLKFQEISKGVWFPVKGQAKTAGSERVEVYEAKTVILNQGLTVKDFDFEFPPGTRIRDEITPELFDSD